MLVHVEQGLGFQDGLLFGEGVEGVQAEFVLAGIAASRGADVDEVREVVRRASARRRRSTR